MKNKLILIGSIVAIILVVIIIAIFIHNRSTFAIETKEDGSINIIAKNASENSGGMGEVTIQEGKKLEVKANLEKDPSIKMKITKSETEVVLEENFKQTDEREFELPSGSYNIFITAEKGVTGNMTINVK